MWFIQALSATVITLVNGFAIYQATKDSVKNNNTLGSILGSLIFSSMFIYIMYLAIVGARAIGN